MPRQRSSDNSYDSPQPIEELLCELQDMLDPARFQLIQAWHLAHWEQLTPVQQRLLEKMYTILVVDRAPYHNQPPTEPGTPEDDHNKKTTAAYTFVVLKAIRHGLEDHPTLDEWWRSRAVTGNRRVLRRAKRGLEKYAIKPYSTEEAEEAEAYFKTGQVPPALNELLLDLLISDWWRHPQRPLPQGVTCIRSDETTDSLSPPRLIFNGSPDDLVRLDKEQRREGKSLRSLHRFLCSKKLIPTKKGKQKSWQEFHKWVKRRGIL